jgi:hypothetical protein
MKKKTRETEAETANRDLPLWLMGIELIKMSAPIRIQKAVRD